MAFQDQVGALITGPQHQCRDAIKGVITATLENMMREVGREKRANSSPVTAATSTIPSRISAEATIMPVGRPGIHEAIADRRQRLDREEHVIREVAGTRVGHRTRHQEESQRKDQIGEEVQRPDQQEEVRPGQRQHPVVDVTPGTRYARPHGGFPTSPCEIRHAHCPTLGRGAMCGAETWPLVLSWGAAMISRRRWDRGRGIVLRVAEFAKVFDPHRVQHAEQVVDFMLHHAGVEAVHIAPDGLS